MHDHPRPTWLVRSLLAALLLLVSGISAAFAAQSPARTAQFGARGYLKASNTDIWDHFGRAVALDGDTLVVGASYEDSAAAGVDGDQTDNNLENAGAAYVFTRSNGVWRQQAYLKASNPDSFDSFGWSVAISGDTLVVGAPFESSAAKGVGGDQTNNDAWKSGAAYVFTRSNGVWSQQAYLKASNTDMRDVFGGKIDLDGDTLVVSALGEASAATGVDGDQTDNSTRLAGAVYIFTRTSNEWSQQAYLKASNTERDDEFGHDVAISGDTVVASSSFEASAATGANGDQTNNDAPAAGAAYVFARSNGVWRQQAYLKASNAEAGDRFGTSLAMDGATLVVGAYGENSAATGVNGDQADNTAYAAGAAYVFTRTNNEWSQQAYLKASNTGAWDEFGTDVALAGGTLVIGALGEASATGSQADNSVVFAGAAYVFTRTDGIWSQHAYRKATHPDAYDWFGHAVAISGTTIVAAAPQDDSASSGVDGDPADDSAEESGAVYTLDAGDTSGPAFQVFAPVIGR